MIDKKIKIKSCIRKYAITDRDLMNGGEIGRAHV